MKILRSSILEAGIDDHQQVPKALGAQRAMNVRRGGNHARRPIHTTDAE
jgi:hypothetical protein